MSGRCDRAVPLAVKIVVSGGLGVGKTTFIGAISEVGTVDSEAAITQVSVGVDSLDGIESKTTTTVALDFGRITISPDVVLYLFGTPGQDRFWFMWDELAQGAVGAVVLVDTRRLDSSFPAVDYFERRGIPFVAAVNRFFGQCAYTEEEIRAALELHPEVPLVWCDARDRSSSKETLIALVRHAMARMSITA